MTISRIMPHVENKLLHFFTDQQKPTRYNQYLDIFSLNCSTNGCEKLRYRYYNKTPKTQKHSTKTKQNPFAPMLSRQYYTSTKHDSHSIHFPLRHIHHRCKSQTRTPPPPYHHHRKITVTHHPLPGETSPPRTSAGAPLSYHMPAIPTVHHVDANATNNNRKPPHQRQNMYKNPKPLPALYFCHQTTLGTASILRPRRTRDGCRWVLRKKKKKKQKPKKKQKTQTKVVRNGKARDYAHLCHARKKTTTYTRYVYTKHIHIYVKRFSLGGVSHVTYDMIHTPTPTPTSTHTSTSTRSIDRTFLTRKKKNRPPRFSKKKHGRWW